MTRTDGRTNDALRPVRFHRGWQDHGEGSCLVEFGRTRVLCVASLSAGVPRWRKDSGLGWVTAEYSMLPRATDTRGSRESVKGKLSGRTQEISRLIGRSLRAVPMTQCSARTRSRSTATFCRPTAGLGLPPSLVPTWRLPMHWSGPRVPVCWPPPPSR